MQSVFSGERHCGRCDGCHIGTRRPELPVQLWSARQRQIQQALPVLSDTTRTSRPVTPFPSRRLPRHDAVVAFAPVQSGERACQPTRGPEQRSATQIHDVVTDIYCEFNVHVIQTTRCPLAPTAPSQHDRDRDRYCEHRAPALSLRRSVGQTLVPGGDPDDANPWTSPAFGPGTFQALCHRPGRTRCKGQNPQRNDGPIRSAARPLMRPHTTMACRMPTEGPTAAGEDRCRNITS